MRARSRPPTSSATARRPSEAGIAELGVSEHIHRFEQSLGVWDHPFWREQALDDIDAYCAFVREETDLRLGLEVDFVPGREDRTQNLIERCELDYVVGSVHFLGDLAVDFDRFDIWESARSPEAVWRRYFETLAAAARSGLFDILAHPDLVKMWGVEPSAPGRRPAPLLRAGARGDRRDGDRGRGLDRRAAQAGRPRSTRRRRSSPARSRPGAPIALSSDAHVPEQVGFGYDRALELLDDARRARAGASSSGATRRLEPIGR